MLVSMNRTRVNRRAAFTLMEVLVVVAIVVILASVGTLATLKFLEDAKIDTARASAQNLLTYAKTYEVKHGGDPFTDMTQLSEYADSGNRALLDPWQQQYQFTYKVDSLSCKERLFIYTVHKTTGQVIGAPRELEGQ